MSVGRWAGGFFGSVAAHGLAAGALALTLGPRDTPQQPVPETALDLAAYAVDRTEAPEAQPEADAATEGETEGAAVGTADVPQSTASAAPVPTEQAEVAAAEGARVAADVPDTDPVAVAETVGATAPALAATGEAAAESPVAPEPLAARPAPVAEPAAVSAPEVAAMAAALPTAVAAVPAAVPEAVPVPPVAVPETTVATPAAPVAEAVQDLSPETAPLASATPEATLALAAAPRSEAMTEAPPPATFTIAELAAAAPAVASQPPDASALAAAIPAAFTPPVAAPDAPAAAALTPEVDAPAPSDPAARADAAPDIPPPADFAKAATAWAGADGQLDPQSLAAIQAFMRPSDLGRAGSNAGTVKDGIEGLLSNVPCARLQAAFVPETGALELRGHIPEEGLRGPVLAALQAQMGTSIPVADNMLILPRPQCGALAGLSNLGLPQSTEALDNPLIVGEDAHAVVYAYQQDDVFTFTMQAPEYDAYVYVDFFMADGNVLHLMPNEYLAMERRVADSVVQIGQDPCGDHPFCIKVAPPFGQEIAAAFASSVPLYDGLRPIVEPAEPYLAYMADRIAEARAADPEFKGEWVYFFITTSAR